MKVIAVHYRKIEREKYKKESQTHPQTCPFFNILMYYLSVFEKHILIIQLQSHHMHNLSLFTST